MIVGDGMVDGSQKVDVQKAVTTKQPNLVGLQATEENGFYFPTIPPLIKDIFVYAYIHIRVSHFA